MPLSLGWGPLQPDRIVEFEETGSTNTEAMRLGMAGAAAGTWVLARRQTAGRGRSGRTWTSLEGNLHASIILPEVAPLETACQLALVSGIAAHDAIVRATRLREVRRLELKWPNDILLDRAKLGGILVESTVIGTASSALAVIGFGLNLAASPSLSPGAPVATSMRSLGAALEPREMLAILDSSLQEWLGNWACGEGCDRIRKAWLERSVPLGTALTVEAARGRVAGSFAGLDADGALLLADARGKSSRFSFGDVTLG